MNNELKEKIELDFNESEYSAVYSALESITLKHVMAESQFNLDNTWMAILTLSKGSLSELENLVQSAKSDFRDLIYWATLEMLKIYRYNKSRIIIS